MSILCDSLFSPKEDLLQALLEDDFHYFQIQTSLHETLAHYSQEDLIVDLLSMESWSGGYEGFIQNSWFNFTQFIKKIIRYVKTMLDHFFSGINRKKRYLESKKISIIRDNSVNWSNLKVPVEGIYFKQEAFQTVSSLCTAIQSFLNKAFNDPKLDFDVSSDLEQWDITFSNGSLRYNRLPGSLVTNFFLNSALFDKRTESLERKKFDKNSILSSIDFLINSLEYSNKKDYLFIAFRDAMERLIRTASLNDDKADLSRFRNNAKSIATLVSFMTELIIRSSNQMIKIIKVLETPELASRANKVAI